MMAVLGGRTIGVVGMEKITWWDVPQGTRVYGFGEGGDKQVLADLVDMNAVWTATRGGQGGRGNAKFAYSQNRVPTLG